MGVRLAFASMIAVRTLKVAKSTCRSGQPKNSIWPTAVRRRSRYNQLPRPLVQYIALTLNRGDGKLIQVGRTIRVSQRTRDEQRPRCDTSWRGILVTV